MRPIPSGKSPTTTQESSCKNSGEKDNTSDVSGSDKIGRKQSHWNASVVLDDFGDTVLEDPDPCPECGNSAVWNVRAAVSSQQVADGDSRFRVDDHINHHLSVVTCARCGKTVYEGGTD
jgi:ribosomal protein S27AE